MRRDGCGWPGDGLCTAAERGGVTRSDCHGWSAHPHFHFSATILGIRPASFGFGAIRIEPQLGPLRVVKGHIPHPQGMIEVAIRCSEEIHATIQAPPDVPFVLVLASREMQGIGKGTAETFLVHVSRCP
jgi:hypothetical protein